MTKNTKNKKDLIFKIILSALIAANTVFAGVNTYNTSKIAKNMQSEANVNTPSFNFEINYSTPTSIQTISTSETVNEVKKEMPDDIPYIIEKGDKLSEIINANYGKYDYKLLMAFAQYNNIKNIDKIYTGDFIYIPTEQKLNEIIAKNNGFAVKTQTQTQPSVIAKSNEITSDTKDLKSDITEIKQNIRANTDEINALKKDVNTIDAKVEENADNIDTMKTQIKVNSDTLDFYEGEIRLNSDEIQNTKSKVEENAEKIDSVNEKLDNHKILEANEIQRIDEKLNTLEQNYLDGQLSIDEVLKRMTNIENAINNLSNDSISKEEVMSVIDNQETSKQTPQPKLIPDEEMVIPSDEIETPKSEIIPDEEMVIPSDEIETPNAELIPDEETTIPSENSNVLKEETLPTQEKLTNEDVPYFEEVSPATETENAPVQNEEVSPLQNEEEILPRKKNIHIGNFPESIFAYAKTR